MLGTGVDEQQIAVPQPIGVLGVVQRAGVHTAGHDGRIRRSPAPGAGEHVQQLRLDLVLAHSRAADAHGALMGGGAHLGRLRHHADLRLALEQPHLVDEVIEHDEFAQAPARSRAAAHPSDPGEHALIELLEVPHRAVHARLVLEQSGQDVVDVADGKRVVGAVALAGPFEPEPGPVPLLRRGVALPAEHHELALLASGREHRHRLGLAETGEVVEAAVGTVGEIDVAIARPHRRGGHDRDAPLPHHVHQAPPAGSEFASMHVEWCSESGGIGHPACAAGEHPASPGGRMPVPWRAVPGGLRDSVPSLPEAGTASRARDAITAARAFLTLHAALTIDPVVPYSSSCEIAAAAHSPAFSRCTHPPELPWTLSTHGRSKKRSTG